VLGHDALPSDERERRLALSCISLGCSTWKVASRDLACSGWRAAAGR
jgi:hypothetical protein